MTMELFKQESGISMLHVPYRGIAPAINEILGGQTQAMFPGLSAALPHLRSRRLRALAVTGETRSPQIKDVPTMAEAGFKGFNAVQWYGCVGPAGLKGDVLDRLSDTLISVIKAPDLAEKLSAEAIEPQAMAPKEFGQFVSGEIQRWSALAKARNIRLDS